MAALLARRLLSRSPRLVSAASRRQALSILAPLATVAAAAPLALAQCSAEPAERSELIQALLGSRPGTSNGGDSGCEASVCTGEDGDVTGSTLNEPTGSGGAHDCGGDDGGDGGSDGGTCVAEHSATSATSRDEAAASDTVGESSADGMKAPEGGPEHLADEMAGGAVTADADDGTADADDGPDPPRAIEERVSAESVVTTLAERRNAWRFLLQMLDIGMISVGILLTLCSAALSVTVPARAAGLLRLASRGALTGGAVARVLGAALAHSLISVAASTCLIGAATRVAVRLQRRIFASLLEQELTFADAQHPGGVISAVTADVELVERAFYRQLESVLTAATAMLGGILQLLYASPHLTLFVLLAAPPIAALASVSAESERSMRAVHAASAAHSAQHATHIFGSVRVVQMCAQEAAETDRYGRLAQGEGVLQRRVLGFHKVWTSALQLSTTVCTALGAAAGGMLAARGLFEPEQLLTFVQLAGRVGVGMGALLHASADATRASEALRRLHALGTREAAIAAEVGTRLEPHSPAWRFFQGEMALKNVSFAYPARPAVPVLRDCELTLRPGTVTALVGESGSGKSTVIQLLSRFYDPDDGVVTIDGAELTGVQPRWLRDQVLAVVPQEPVMFPGTVGDNIAYARPDASHQQIEAAAKAANAHAFVEALPEGYETQIGGAAGGLSLGQRQRIAIARALLKEPRVLLLDEPTSALDPESEALVQQALERLMQGRTVLVVAHRLSTVQTADQIAVLHGGAIVEQGTHQALMRTGGRYATMVRAAAQHQT